MDISPKILPKLVGIAHEAGRAILSVYESDFDFEVKGDGSPLTIADQKADILITEHLNALTPDIPVLSEETYHKVGDARLDWPMYWLIDPLDGTKEFINKNGEFTVNIALIHNKQPIIGVVHTPVKDISHFAMREKGAFLKHGERAATAIHTRSLNKSQANLVASRSHKGEAVAQFEQNLAQHVDQVDCISMGSSLKLCLVAEGKADFYPRLGLTSEWDTAAAQCIVEAAGGKVIDEQGAALSYSKADILNPWFLVVGDPSININFAGEIG